MHGHRQYASDDCCVDTLVVLNAVLSLFVLIIMHMSVICSFSSF